MQSQCNNMCAINLTVYFKYFPGAWCWKIFRRWGSSDDEVCTAGLDLTGLAGLDRTGLAGLDQTGLAGLDRTGLSGWTGSDWTGWTGSDWTGWIGLVSSGRTLSYWTYLNVTGLDQTRMAGPDQTGLAGSDWTGKTKLIITTGSDWTGWTFYLDVCTRFLKLKHSFLILLQSTNIGIHVEFCIYIYF